MDYSLDDHYIKQLPCVLDPEQRCPIISGRLWTVDRVHRLTFRGSITGYMKHTRSILYKYRLWTVGRAHCLTFMGVNYRVHETHTEHIVQV